MKKLLLFCMISSPFMALAQKTLRLNNPAPLQKNQKVSTETKKTGPSIQSRTNPAPVANPMKTSSITYPIVQIGTSTYDLQTNASIGRRVMEYSGGKVSVTWTYSGGTNPWDDRGTGYNHFDGTSWGSYPSVRVEGGTSANRTGWPSIGLLGTQEYVFGHLSATGGFLMSKNASIGSGSWTPGGVILNDNTVRRPIWGRVANSGNIIHVISNYSDSSSDNPVTTYKAGVRDPMVYSRSLDGGASWPIKNSLLPGYDSTLLFEGGGDSYAIDVRDSIVAIVSGGLGEHVMLWKSTDNGNTFTKIYCDSLDFAPYNNRKVIGTGRRTNDGSMDVVIDNLGKVHAFWGLSAVTQTNASADSARFAPASFFLMHWNETNMSSDTIGFAIDRNNDSTLSIVQGTTAFTPNITGDPSWGAARYGNLSLVTMPSAGVDANNNIYCVYSSIVELDTNFFDKENFRDIYVVHSTDGGLNWANPQNLTQNLGVEDVFACINKRITNKIHMVWQRDFNPGTELQNQDLPGTNEMMYAGIPIADILNNSIGDGPALSVPTLVRNDLFMVGQNYPNPFNGETSIPVTVSRGTNISFSLVNIIGQQVMQFAGNMEKGVNEIRIDGSTLRPGIYFYSVEGEGFKETRKMIVE